MKACLVLIANKDYSIEKNEFIFIIIYVSIIDTIAVVFFLLGLIAK